MPSHVPDVALSLMGDEMEKMHSMLVAPHISEKLKRNGEPYVPTRYVRPLELPSLPGKYRRLGDDQFRAFHDARAELQASGRC